MIICLPAIYPTWRWGYWWCFLNQIIDDLTLAPFKNFAHATSCFGPWTHALWVSFMVDTILYGSRHAHVIGVIEENKDRTAPEKPTCDPFQIKAFEKMITSFFFFFISYKVSNFFALILSLLLEGVTKTQKPILALVSSRCNLVTFHLAPIKLLLPKSKHQA